MASNLDHIHIGKNILSFILEENSSIFLVIAVQPLLVFVSKINRALELSCPLQMRAVEMRVRNGNSDKSSTRVDEVNGLLVQQTDTVPEDIARLCLDEDGSLPNCHLRSRED